MKVSARCGRSLPVKATCSFPVMAKDLTEGVVDTLTLRFIGEEEDGSTLHALRASHVAEVLQGLVGLTSDFDKAGVFNFEGPAGSEVLVRPAQEGSFLIEVVRIVTENPEAAAGVSVALGLPTLSQVIWWATKSARADVKDFDHLENGNVKVTWQDDTSEEIPEVAWVELNKRDRRRKRHLRQIMAPLSDPRVSSVNVAAARGPEIEPDEGRAEPELFVLSKLDYDAVKPSDDVEERQEIFETEARMSAIDFDDPTRWRVRTAEATRAANVEDKAFLKRVTHGLAIRKDDIFNLRVREDVIVKNGRTRTTWTVLHVESHRRAAGENDS